MNALSNTIPTDIFLTEKGFANLKAMLARKQAEYAEVGSTAKWRLSYRAMAGMTIQSLTVSNKWKPT